MPRRLTALTALTFALAAAPAAAQDATPAPAPSPSPAPAPAKTIADRVYVAGVPVGGLTLDAAAAKVEQAFAEQAMQTITLTAAGKTYRLSAKRAKVTLDPMGSARRAYQQGEDGKGKVVRVLPKITFIKTPIRQVVGALAKRVSIASRNASVRITTTRIFRRSQRNGRALNSDTANRAIEAAFADPRKPRTIKPGVRVVKPAVTYGDVLARYGRVVTVQRSTFRLRYFRNFRLEKSYGVAVGKPGHTTPAGLFNVQSKQVNPTWTAPNSPWAGEMAGQSVSGGAANNPLKARWIGVNGSIGIHGTGEPGSIGSRASHGCIRMRVPDVKDLFNRVSVGTPVLIR